MHTYDIAIRYKRADGKLRWFYGQQLAANKRKAEEYARASFASELPGINPVSMFITRRPVSDD